MVMVSVTFALCFACSNVYPILTALKLVSYTGTLRFIFAVFTYASRCLNPFIYATQYEVVTRWWKVVAFRLVCRGQVEEAPITIPAVPATSGKQQTTSGVNKDQGQDYSPKDQDKA